MNTKNISLILVILILIIECKSIVKDQTSVKKKTFIVVANMVNVRSKPSTTSEKIGQLEVSETGEELERTETTELVNGKTGIWIKIKTIQVEGWVFSPYIRNSVPYSESCNNPVKKSKFIGRIGYPSEGLDISGLYIQNYTTKKITNIPYIDDGSIENSGKFQISMPPGKYLLYAKASTYNHKIYFTYCSGYDDYNYKKDPFCSRVIIIIAKEGCEYSQINDFEYSNTEALMP
ncbi:SH3 domain-containing protein [Leptospira bandrabouensis]|uniref:SH3 domain-containing protein n=1 Tax=Leptospira bandrabouensis TaxID=2484903 RepID=UPI00223CB8D2|nr:SH3 domain-containing protein [Leptospira bandrabouensis]MCW7460441.1 SH3 domain-containing protein [Leptospira bandrabouensis]MCW7479420.1 SH3 domain-containing protein [Leptospira bandrabouensis]MCW7487102.1 SH3 domain-containing protein [Leptospira bandrabouensis]